MPNRKQISDRVSRLLFAAVVSFCRPFGRVRLRNGILILAVIACPLTASAEDTEDTDSFSHELFAHYGQPLLKRYCLDCHSEADSSRDSSDTGLTQVATDVPRDARTNRAYEPLGIKSGHHQLRHSTSTGLIPKNSNASIDTGVGFPDYTETILLRCLAPVKNRRSRRSTSSWSRSWPVSWANSRRSLRERGC